MATAGHRRHPCTRGAVRAIRRDPAVPELLGGVPGDPARPRGPDWRGEKPMEITDSVAVVTGANRGLGRHFAAQLLERGAAKLYAAARDPHMIDLPGVVPLQLDI